MPDLNRYVGLDVGGTTMKAAVVDDQGTPGPAVVMNTNPELGQEQGLETMCETIRRCVQAAGLTMDDIAGIGVATPGLMDIKLGLILDPPNLKPWRNVPVPEHIRQVFHKPTAFQNDANAAAYGEFWVGAGQDVDSMALFTLGTGVGGGLIVRGDVLEGEHSHGAELGHMRIELPSTGRLCGCGRRGCLEAYASATAVVARTREAMACYRERTSLKELILEGDGAEFSAKDVFAHAASGDELARQIVDDTAFYLAMGACNIIATVDPEVIAFGGGMIGAGAGFLDRIQEYVLRFGLNYPAKQVYIRYAQLGSNAGYIGAAGCARRLIQSQVF